jgi:hypothetical protein
VDVNTLTENTYQVSKFYLQNVTNEKPILIADFQNAGDLEMGENSFEK